MVAKNRDRKMNLEEARVLLASDDDDEEIFSSQVVSKTKENNEPDYQVALDALGFGKFHVILLLVCGLANASDAVEILCVSLLLPSVHCDLDITSSARKGWLAAIIFIGMMVGSYFWGSLGDIYGRRSTLCISLMINGIFGGLSGLAQEYYFFLAMRFVSGVGVGGSIPLVFSYFTEFQSNNKRASQLCLLAGFWMVGNIITAGLGWIIIPHKELGFFSTNFTFNSWRIFVMCCSIFSVSSAIMLMFLPNSPIFLLKQARYDQAQLVLTKVFSINHGSHSEYEAGIVENIRQSVTMLEKPHKEKRILSRNLIQKLFLKMKLLFGHNLLKNSTILCAVNFSLAFGYYGLWLWFPELFSRLAAYNKANPGVDVSVCDIPHVNTSNLNVTNSECSSEVDPTVFFDTFIMALSNFPGVLMTVLYMDKFGRKYFLAGGLISSSISTFFIWLVKKRLHNLILSCFFGGLSVVSFNALNVITAELFPTEVRSTAMGVFLFVARIGAILGNVLFGYLIDLKCEVPILLIASLMCGSGLVTIFLPNTTRIHIK